MGLFADGYCAVEERAHGVLVRYSVAALRVSVGAVFLASVSSSSFLG